MSDETEKEPLDRFLEDYDRLQVEFSKSRNQELLKTCQLKVLEALGTSVLDSLAKQGLSPWLDQPGKGLSTRDFNFHGQNLMLGLDLKPAEHGGAVLFEITAGKGAAIQREGVPLTNLTLDWFVNSLRRLAPKD